MSESVQDPQGPVLRIVRGDASAEEVAVLAALLAAASSAAAPSRERVRRGGWNDPGWLHQVPVVPGPNAWRAAVLPR